MLKKSTFLNQFWGTSCTVKEKKELEPILIFKINGGLVSKKVQSCTKFNLQTFFTYFKKNLLHKNLRYDMMLISALFNF